MMKSFFGILTAILLTVGSASANTSEYQEKISKMGKSRITVEFASQLSQMAAMCGVGVTVTVVTGVLNTLPAVGMFGWAIGESVGAETFPTYITAETKKTDADHVAIFTGSALGSLVDVIAMLLDYAPDEKLDDRNPVTNYPVGEYNKPFHIARAAYAPATGIAKALLGKNSSCQANYRQIVDLSNEVDARAQAKALAK